MSKYGLINKRVFVTGATGFVGLSLIHHLVDITRYEVLGAIRNESYDLSSFPGVPVYVQSICDTDWTSVLQGVDTVIHLAARAHVMHDSADDPLALFREINTYGTEHIARGAHSAGVRRFIYLSSIKVNGERTEKCVGKDGGNANITGPDPIVKDTRFTESDIPNPQDPYAVSKFEAEQILRGIAEETGMDVVVIRPPLIYGAGVKANFYRMMESIDKGFPLPVGDIRNRRSLVGLGNLMDLITTCILHPAAANETFLVSDGEDLSTPELVRRIAMHMGVKAHLLAVPVWLLTIGGKIFGKSAEIARLCGSLQVDISKAEEVLDWKPPFSVDEGLKETIDWYMASKDI